MGPSKRKPVFGKTELIKPWLSRCICTVCKSVLDDYNLERHGSTDAMQSLQAGTFPGGTCHRHVFLNTFQIQDLTWQKQGKCSSTCNNLHYYVQKPYYIPNLQLPEVMTHPSLDIWNGTYIPDFSGEVLIYGTGHCVHFPSATT